MKTDIKNGCEVRRVTMYGCIGNGKQNSKNQKSPDWGGGGGRQALFTFFTWIINLISWTSWYIYIVDIHYLIPYITVLLSQHLAVNIQGFLKLLTKKRRREQSV